MAMPKSATKITKNGVEFTESIDRAKYTITELSRAALRDSAKFIRRKMNDEVRKLPGMRRARRPYRSNQYWVRRRETDLQVGFKHGTWYRSEERRVGTESRSASAGIE